MSTNSNTNFPEKKRITNKDVAKFAEVSVATVSYVIIGRTDQRISESTQKSSAGGKLSELRPQYFCRRAACCDTRTNTCRKIAGKCFDHQRNGCHVLFSRFFESLREQRLQFDLFGKKGTGSADYNRMYMYRHVRNGIPRPLRRELYPRHRARQYYR